MRDKCLNEHLFPSLAAARRIIEAWRTDYNTVRPHSSLGGMAPAEFTSPPAKGMRTPKLTYQRPENGEQVTSAGVGDQPRQRLLSATTDLGFRPHHNEKDRRVTRDFPFAGIRPD